VPGRKSRGLSAAFDGPGAIAGTDAGADALSERDMPGVGQPGPEPALVENEK